MSMTVNVAFFYVPSDLDHSGSPKQLLPFMQHKIISEKTLPINTTLYKRIVIYEDQGCRRFSNPKSTMRDPEINDEQFNMT